MILEKMSMTENFTDSEQTIIQYLLSHPEDILMMSVRDLAKASFTSSSTVNRLAGKLSDHKGFTQFKADLFSELHNNRFAGESRDFATSPESDIRCHEDMAAIAETIATLETETIAFMKNHLDYDKLDKVIEILKSTGTLYFFGFDNNLSMVKSYLNRMMTFGKPVVTHDAQNAQFYQALTIPNNSCALIISRTGANRTLVEIMQVLKEKNVKIIALTPITGSPIGQLADVALSLKNDSPFEAVGNVVYETSLSYILNLLCSLLFSNNYTESKKVLEDYNTLYLRHENIFMK